MLWLSVAVVVAVAWRGWGTGIDVETLASATPGFSGADLFSMINSAALMAASRGADKVELRDIEEARDKIIMGAWGGVGRRCGAGVRQHANYGLLWCVS